MDRIYVGWKDVIELAKRDAPLHHGFDTLAGVSRGGVVLASLFHRFHPTKELKIIEPDCSLCVGDKNILVIDDIWDTGNTIRALIQKAFIREGNLMFYTLISKHTDTTICHSYGKLLPKDRWVVFPWEIEEEV